MAVSNRYKTAVSLGYESGPDDVPEVSAKGEHFIADEIVRIARRYGIPVIERAELAQALNSIEIDQPIPPQLYEAVAALLIEIEKRSK